MSSELQNNNPFDPASLRIDPSMGGEIGVKKALLHLSVRKPNRQEYFRTHRDPAYRLNLAILELKEEREIYAVLPEIAAAMPGETRAVDLRLCINRSNSLFLWHVPLPTADGRENAWHKTARDIAVLAETQWVRMAANMSAGCYDVFIAPPGLSEPIWPEQSLSDLLRIAFGGGRLIDDANHPVLNRLRGQ
jgi:hypothetical protein